VDQIQFKSIIKEKSAGKDHQEGISRKGSAGRDEQPGSNSIDIVIVRSGELKV
jgi:hypothetical protein